MATYAIGDLQGCLRELEDLLHHVNFDDRRDRLWFVGDIVNRGPESLPALEFVAGLGDTAITVLGNHDLHLLAVAHGQARSKRRDTLDDVLGAGNRERLLDWLRRQPLLHVDRELAFAMVHAGLPPQWDVDEAGERAREVESVLRSGEMVSLLGAMYGDRPDRWQEDLEGMDRLRFIINCLTRMRYCTGDGRLSLGEKGPPGSQPAGLLPWYCVPGRRSAGTPFIFGHWSTVMLGDGDDFDRFGVRPLDAGCVWGGSLLALRLEDRRLFSVPSRQPKRFGANGE